MAEPGFVIVGAGEAGARAAMALREAGYEGPVTLIGEEAHPPYERPPLSKAAMTSADSPAAATILTPQHCEDNRIGLLSGVPAAAIDRAARTVVLSDGRRMPYRALLLATGSRARRLSMPGLEGAPLHYLRTFPEALALREALRPGCHLVVIGGGFIGLELASSGIERGCAVTVLEAQPRLLGRAVPADVAGLLAERHRRAGIGLRLGAAIASVERDGARIRLHLADGEAITSDLIVVGIGALPETALAEAAGLAIDNGIAVDGCLRTSDPQIFAAGDCCSFPHPLYGGRRIRLEAWRNAQDQGTHAARAMLGSAEHFAAVPWFWSDQHDLCLQIAGLPDEGARIVVRDLGDGAVLHFHLDPVGRLVAACGLGPIGRIAKDVRVAEMLIAARASPDPDVLAAPARKLRSLLDA